MFLIQLKDTHNNIVLFYFFFLIANKTHKHTKTKEASVCVTKRIRDIVLFLSR